MRTLLAAALSATTALLPHAAALVRQLAQAAVVGLADERWGERVAAAVVTRAPVEPATLVAHCAERLAGFKRPRTIEIWPELPTSPVGKSLRREVRDRMKGHRWTPIS